MVPAVVFIQLPPQRFAFEEPPSNIPLAAGFLVAALNTICGKSFQTEIVNAQISDTMADAGLAAHLAGKMPAVLAMSLYVWNARRSLYLAARVKRLSPETRVLVGGPEVTPDNRWVIEHPAVDAGVFGEGESRIADVLETLLGEGSATRPPGTFFKTPDGLLMDTSPVAPWDLGSAHYPYLDHALSLPRDGTLFLETLRGCPFRCGYCYYHKAFQGVRHHSEGSIDRVLDMAYAQDSGVNEIYLMDPSFNTGPRFRDLLADLCRRRACKDVKLHAELRADLLNGEDAQLLDRAGLKTAEVGLQSIHRQVLATAGRTGDPRRVARGVEHLKGQGIDVTTGIILGLPGDTPAGFASTVTWLRDHAAYSEVQPFVLSVLPGTDFRLRAAQLGLEHDIRPPYYVRSTRTFPREEFRPALLECEQTLDMEIDHIPLPSLVDSGGSIDDADRTAYVSKWIVDFRAHEAWKALLPLVAAKATDPFTLWFRGVTAPAAEKDMLTILGQFSCSNPHAIVRVILEFQDFPRAEFFGRAVEAGVHPGLYINRYYEPLIGDDQVVSVDFTLVVPWERARVRQRLIEEDYLPSAAIVHEIARPFDVDLSEVPLPVMVSWDGRSDLVDRLFDMLSRAWPERLDEVLFRSRELKTRWDREIRNVRTEFLFEEKILVGPK